MPKQEFKLGIHRRFFNKNLKNLVKEPEERERVYREMKKIFKSRKTWGKTSLTNTIAFRKNPKEDERIALAVILKTPIDSLFPEHYEDLYNQIKNTKKEGEIILNLSQIENRELLQIEAPIDIEKEASDRFEVKNYLSILRPKELGIIKLRYGIDCEKTHSLEEVGKEFGITRERVRQIEAAALQKMRIFFLEKIKKVKEESKD